MVIHRRSLRPFFNDESIDMSEQETIIAQGVRVEGDFMSKGPVIIDGDVAGSVKTASSLRVGESAQIEADVSAKSAVIAGRVQGNIVVEEQLELLESAHVQGDITAKVLSIVRGSSFNGSVSMSQKGSAHESKDA